MLNVLTTCPVVASVPMIHPLCAKARQSYPYVDKVPRHPRVVKVVAMASKACKNGIVDDDEAGTLELFAPLKALRRAISRRLTLGVARREFVLERHRIHAVDCNEESVRRPTHISPSRRRGEAHKDIGHCRGPMWCLLRSPLTRNTACWIRDR